MAKKTREDPTGQRVNRKNAARKLSARLEASRRAVIQLFKRIPSKRVIEKIIVNDSLALYQYVLSPGDAEQLEFAITDVLNRSFTTGSDTMPPDWWYKAQIEIPHRQGALEELVTVNQQLEVAAISVIGVEPVLLSLPAVLFSPDYLDGLRMAEVRNYGLIKTLASDAADDALGVIMRGIDSGKSPRSITGLISERFELAEFKAKRIADTEINRAYNDARLISVNETNKMGNDVAVLHISSLTSTTRPNHAARHGNVYTPQQQAAWWNDGVNRINCKCTTRSIILDGNGKVLDSELQKSFRDMRNSSKV